VGVGHVRRLGDEINCYRILFGNPKSWSPNGRCMSESNVEKGIKEKGGKKVD
jgi:hypothetical protein